MVDDDPDDGRDDVRTVEVWECNLDAVAVFQLCTVDGIGHMGGIYWQGIAPGEIRSACLLLRLPRIDWPELAQDVGYMGGCVANERNREAAARAKK